MIMINTVKMIDDEQEIRWKQRLNNFQRAVFLMQEIPNMDLEKRSFLEKEGGSSIKRKAL